MVETCLAGVSTRGTEDAGEIPWCSGASNLNQEASEKVDAWPLRPFV